MPLSLPWRLVLGTILLISLAAPLVIAGALFYHGYQLRDPSITPLLYMAALAFLAFFVGQCRTWRLELELGRPEPPKES